jgi:hypothetical protein
MRLVKCVCRLHLDVGTRRRVEALEHAADLVHADTHRHAIGTAAVGDGFVRIARRLVLGLDRDARGGSRQWNR